MIQLIVGKKGSGKTKRLIQQTNEAAVTRRGSVIFIDEDKDYLYDIRHEVRFIDSSEYFIENADMFYGFVCGIAAKDFDLDAVYVDAFLRIVKAPMAQLEDFFAKLKKITDEHNIDMVLSVSAAEADIPAYARGWMI